MFTRGSRYEPIRESEYTAPDGRVIRYKRIRFVPTPTGPSGAIIEPLDRPDLAAWRVAQDPEAFWRLCDANIVARPADLTARPGTRIVVPQPGSEGAP
ncbi:MAG: hypothetical protein ACR2KT_17375 [Methylocella sp.]|nr:MAG: hypothetical protein DLM68_01615 [Hyphomicrobiales bacterium]